MLLVDEAIAIGQTRITVDAGAFTFAFATAYTSVTVLGMGALPHVETMPRMAAKHGIEATASHVAWQTGKLFAGAVDAQIVLITVTRREPAAASCRCAGRHTNLPRRAQTRAVGLTARVLFDGDAIAVETCTARLAQTQRLLGRTGIRPALTDTDHTQLTVGTFALEIGCRARRLWGDINTLAILTGLFFVLTAAGANNGDTARIGVAGHAHLTVGADAVGVVTTTLGLGGDRDAVALVTTLALRALRTPIASLAIAIATAGVETYPSTTGAAFWAIDASGFDDRA